MVRMAPSITIFIALVAAYAFEAWAEGRAEKLQGCQALTECLMLLDKAELPTGQMLGDEREITDNLRRFGDAAKRELLRRAVGDHRGWRNLAGAVLRYWGDWSPSDVSALRTSLQLEHGGWIAWPLADIGTPDAIQTLVEDLIVIGPMSQTGAALEKLGARVLAYLLPMLEDERQALQADTVIQDMGHKALDEAANWLALAEGPEHPKRSRLAALRGLAAMGELVQPHAGRLRALRSDPDADLRDQALKTLIAIRDSSVAPLVGEKCKPSAAALEATPVQSVICIRDVALFGGNGRGAGPNLMPLLQSKNGAELATAIAVLGYIGYDEAIPAIREAIRAPDWRVVQAAVLSLGWLGAIEAIPDLEQVAASHWLPEVRQQAQAVLDILKSGHPKTVRPERFLMNESVPFGSYSYGIRPQAAERCPSQKWEWQGRPIARPRLTDARRSMYPVNIEDCTLLT
jgi:HEAT repeat protein